MLGGVAGYCLMASLLTISVSCKDQAACEKERSELAKKWEELKNTAGSYKHTKEDEDLTVAKKEERLRVWSAVEQKADLLASSFSTRQVTWPAAEKARREIGQRLGDVVSTGDPRIEGFRKLLQAANSEYDQYKKKCE
jgi:hypothetical protein